MTSSSVSVVSVLFKNAQLFNELKKTLPNLLFHNVNDPENDEIIKTSKIIIADYDLIGPYLYKLPNTQWLQGTWAGVEKLLKFLKKDDPPPFTITRFSGEHFGRIMGEYVVTQIINYERSNFQVRNNQLAKVWNREGNIFNYRTIYDLTIGILGLGTIGSKVGEILNFLGANVIGYGREIRSNTDKPYIKEYFSGHSLGSFLEQCDYFINILPATAKTNDLLSGDVLQHCRNTGSVFINIGRGNVINEDDLMKALAENWIRGAILDVFRNEPLSKESPLWNFPQVVITPHVAACSRAKDIAAQFKINLELYEKGIPIPTTLDLRKGY